MATVLAFTPLGQAREPWPAAMITARVLRECDFTSNHGGESFLRFAC